VSALRTDYVRGQVVSSTEASAESVARLGGEETGGNQSLATLSNEIVRIYKDQFGRGPTKVRSYYAGPDTLVCLLENTFTPAERSLQGMGEHQRLREMRMFFQYASAGEFTEAVLTATGRRVRSFISGIDTNTDIACEVFVLEPQAPA
jgi:uncharacterized protein YbcI